VQRNNQDADYSGATPGVHSDDRRLHHAGKHVLRKSSVDCGPQLAALTYSPAEWFHVGRGVTYRGLPHSGQHPWWASHTKSWNSLPMYSDPEIADKTVVLEWGVSF
jgi:hypothetical protein